MWCTTPVMSRPPCAPANMCCCQRNDASQHSQFTMHTKGHTLKPDSAIGPASSPVFMCLSRSDFEYSSCSHRNTCVWRQ